MSGTATTATPKSLYTAYTLYRIWAKAGGRAEFLSAVASNPYFEIDPGTLYWLALAWEIRDERT